MDPRPSAVKDPALPELWRKSQLQLRFIFWPGNFHVPWVRPLKKEKRSKEAMPLKSMIFTVRKKYTNKKSKYVRNTL